MGTKQLFGVLAATIIGVTAAPLSAFEFCGAGLDRATVFNPMDITGSDAAMDAVPLSTGAWSLSDALDVAYPWRTGGTTGWISQTAVTHDRLDAARPGALGHRQSSWLATTVTGPKKITFWWKTSSETGDKLRFSIDASVKATRSGKNSWVKKTFLIAAGNHLVKWEFSRNASRSAGANTGYVDQVTIAGTTLPPYCEGCHGNPPHAGCDGIPGTADDAPNVMGDGTAAAGTGSSPRPYDDGTYGFNVNGHGANGTAVNGPTPTLTPNRACTDCHDIVSPSPSTHFTCDPGGNVQSRVNTRFFFGKSADTRNDNTSHLVPGFLSGEDNPEAKQTGFDDYCYLACHRNADVGNFRHASKVFYGSPVFDNITQFALENDTTDDPKQDRGADNAFTPWTIDDLTNIVGVNAAPPTVRHHGVCVSCHDPHGTGTLQKTRLTNKMVVRNWQDNDMPSFCTSNCHRIP